jgi:hypothetical protein
MQVSLPNARNLVEITNSKLTQECAIEFRNYVMLAMEGQRAFRFEPDFHKTEEIIDHKNVIYMELHSNLSAYDFCQVICEYGDIYVVKDSCKGYFVEF